MLDASLCFTAYDFSPFALISFYLLCTRLKSQTMTHQWRQERRLVLSEDLYLQKSSSHSLRVCCYGSSSELTPIEYLEDAYSLGYALGKRGHTCVNGAGMAGCMAAMNDGAADADGNIVGVIHEMFVVDGSDWKEGSHAIFGPNRKSHASIQLLIAGGNDLQQRKKMLAEKADAFVVCPGGPGTFDELWEMACARNINLMDIPIVCINVRGYYDPFAQMLHRAFKDQLIRKQPHEIIHFVDTGLDAVRFIENFYYARRTSAYQEQAKPKLRQQPSFLQRLGSVMSVTLFSSFMESGQDKTLSKSVDKTSLGYFVSGCAVGTALVLVATRTMGRRS